MNTPTLATVLLATVTGACVATVGPTDGSGRDDRDTSDCPVERYTLTLSTEADLRDIPKGCFSLDGDLVIERSTLTDLDALKDLRDVRGALRIEDNRDLTTLTGLNDVRVSGELVIEGNSRLADTAGLEGTDEVTALTLRSNDALRDLSGLRNLDLVAGDVLVSNNGALTTMAGLDKLRTVHGDLVIEVNDQLTSLTGLGRLSAVASVTLERNPRLASVAGMSALSSTDRVLITGNPALTSLTGLGLTRVSGDLDLENNGLTTLGSLSNLTQVGGNLIIASNPSLVGVDGLSAGLFVAGGLRITSNSRLDSIYALYLGVRASNLVITGNPALSRPRADHLTNNTTHQAAFPTRTILGNGTASQPDFEPHG
ncbi:MAG: hypothetical protein IPL61_03195 [Myxococcales bacterium]|nr:hypothetical protein [Myxococcales bacterium]